MLHKESPEGRQPNKDKISGMWLNKSIVAYTHLPIGYFITTSILWSLFYLRKTNFDLIGFIKNWYAIFKLPSQNKRKPISNKALQYLNKVEARLWY